LTSLFNCTVDGLGSLTHNELDTTDLFCSELVAEAYKALGLVPSDLNSSEIVPNDFLFPLNLSGRAVLGFLVDVDLKASGWEQQHTHKTSAHTSTCTCNHTRTHKEHVAIHPSLAQGKPSPHAHNTIHLAHALTRDRHTHIA
jgi:hypothetical protein